MNKGNTSLQLMTPVSFDFFQTVNAHGWSGLLPNKWDSEKNQLERFQKLSDGSVVRLIICDSQSSENEITITIESSLKPGMARQQEIKSVVRHMLRLDEDFSGLYQQAQKQDGHFSGMINGFGRLLRSPTVFEDIVKTICTTNIQWGGTKRMVQELVDGFGTPFNVETDSKSFPAAKDISAFSFDEFSTLTNLGYRSEYIYLLAKDTASGVLDPQSFLDPALTTADLRKKLISIKGIGSYAAATMLMLLGHYDSLPVDSVFKEFVFNKYFDKKAVSQKRAEKIYAGWGKWKSLAYWYDMTFDNYQ